MSHHSHTASIGNTLTKQKSEHAKQLLAKKYAELRARQEMASQGSSTNSSNSNLNLTSTSPSSDSPKHSSFSDLIQSRMSIDDFTILKCVGKGGFGEVLLCKHKETGKIYAIKKLKKLDTTRRKQVFHVWQERNALINVNSKWIIKLHATFQDDIHLYFVMDFLPGGDLMNWLIKRQTFTEKETQFYIAELILAVEEIHELDYIHRDLKPDNILLDANGHIRLTDFGLCKLLEVKKENQHPQVPTDYDPLEVTSPSEIKQVDPITGLNKNQRQELYQKNARREQAFSVVGSPGYVAPEVLKKEGYGMEADFWSVGIIMFEALFGYPPFFSDSPLQTCKKIVRWRHFLEYPTDNTNVSEAAVDLLHHLLCDAKDRVGVKYSVEELKQHAFFKGIDWNRLQEQKAPFQLNIASETDTRYFDDYDLNPVLQSIQSSSQGQKKFRRKKEEDLLFEQFTFKRSEGDLQGTTPKARRPTVLDLFGRMGKDGR